MDRLQWDALQDRLNKVESDLLEQIEARSSSTWFSRNIGLVISTMTILITLAAAWGRIETNIEVMRTTDERLQGQIHTNSGLIRAHHENTTIHMDRGWRSELKSELAEIRNLLIQHMADNGRAKK